MWLLTGSKTINSNVKIFYHEIWRIGFFSLTLPCLKEERCALGNALRLEAEEVVRRDGGGRGGRSPIKGKKVKK